MPSAFNVAKIDTTQLPSLNSRLDSYEIQLIRSSEEDNLFRELLEAFDVLTESLKTGMDQDNDRIGISMIHNELVAKSIDIPLQRPKNLTGQSLLTHFGKVLQSQESIALDGKMILRVFVVTGPSGSGTLNLSNAKNFHDFLKRKRGLIMIENMDNLCLPRAIVAAQTYIQHHQEKSVSRNEYHRIVGNKKKGTDRQLNLARVLCRDCQIDTRPFQSGQKKFGMDEIKVFANFLAPKYGLAVFSSLTANTKVFQTEGACEYWMNLLNLDQHYSVISKPQGFFSKRYWCSQCNNAFSHKEKHRCIPVCNACHTLDTESCAFWAGKTVRCSKCHRGFYGAACLANHLVKSGQRKSCVCDTLHCCKECGVEYSPKQKNKHQCDHSLCSTCKLYLPNSHNCYMPQVEFPDERAY